MKNQLKSLRYFFGRHLYFLPDTWIYKKLRGLPIITCTIDEAQVTIANELNSAKPSLIARIGGNELDFTYNYGLKGRSISESLLKELKVTAGVFDIENTCTQQRLNQEYLSAIANIDVLASWRKEEKFFQLKSISKVGISDLEIFRSKIPFTKEIVGKILIVSPFVETIESQISKAKLNRCGTAFNLFNLDEVEFVFYKPLQTHGNSGLSGFKSWGDALDHQMSEISELYFDTALISCGAYGLPIGNFIKNRLGKKAVVVGGVLQLFFDIMGKRWQTNKRVLEFLYSESLVRPSPEEVPKNSEDIESSAYY